MSDKLLNTVSKDQLIVGRYYFVLTTSLFGCYAEWTGTNWAYYSDGLTNLMAYGITQIIYEAPQP
jgi:hypothetical protein